jgi:phage-related protein
MATFTWTPSFGSPESSQPKVLEADFGDGYSQRVRMGLNSDPKTWDLRFDNRADAERDQIRNFLEARGGVEAFDWTTLYEQTGKNPHLQQFEVGRGKHRGSLADAYRRRPP